MRPNTRGQFGTLGLNTRILLLTVLPVVATAAITTLVIHWSTRRFVEDAVGDQMAMEARIVAHLVAVGEQKRPDGMPPEEIDRHLKEIARFAKAHKKYDYEFWVTDRAGKVYMGTEGVEFTFQPDQPQAGNAPAQAQAGNPRPASQFQNRLPRRGCAGRSQHHRIGARPEAPPGLGDPQSAVQKAVV